MAKSLEYFVRLLEGSHPDLKLLTELAKGVQNWNAYRMENPLLVPRLKGSNFPKINLRGINLNEADLSHSNLSNADLSDANLLRANLMRANLNRANLDGIDLTYTLLTVASLRNASLRGAWLNWANLKNADLTGADLTSADLRKVIHLTFEQISGVKTLYNAILDPELEKEIENNYPNLFERPPDT